MSLDGEEATERLDELLPLTDVLIVAYRFGHRLTGVERVPAILERLAGLGPRLVGLTLGAAGSVVRYRGQTVEAPGLAVNVVDTTGAGDIFHGAFLAGLLWGWPLPEILRLANAVAALKCRRLGGRAGIPSLAEAREFLARTARTDPGLPPALGHGILEVSPGERRL